MKAFRIVLYSIFILFVCYSFSDSEAANEINSHIDRGNKYLLENQPFMAIHEFREAVKKGSDDPVLFRNLSVVLYDLGFIDEAIAEMEKALALSEDSNFLRRELGIMYLSKNQYEKSREQFSAILKSNPGFSEAYYYLGEILYKTGDYDMAWMAIKMAHRLGHKGNGLTGKLSKIAKPPPVAPWDKPGEELFFRQILVASETTADKIEARLKGGELFENIAGEFDKTVDADLGGYKGGFRSTELHPLIARALMEHEPLSDPIIVDTKKGFHIVQRLVPFDMDKWEELIADSGRSNVITVNKLLSLPAGAVKSIPDADKSSISKNKPALTYVQKKKKPSLSTEPLSLQQADHKIEDKPEQAVSEKTELTTEEKSGLKVTEISEKDAPTAIMPYLFLKKKAVKAEVKTEPLSVVKKEAVKVEIKTEPLPVVKKEAVKAEVKTRPYLVHVGTFRQVNNAVALLGRLKKLGYPAYSYTKKTGRGTFHRVVAGEYPTIREAKKAGGELKEKRFDYFISRRK